MAALSLAIVGKQNEPLYLRDFEEVRTSDAVSDEELFGLEKLMSRDTEEEGSGGCSTRQQFVLHAALDRMDQLIGTPPGYTWRKPDTKPGKDAMFMGLLCPVEDMRVYGEANCGYVVARKWRLYSRMKVF